MEYIVTSTKRICGKINGEKLTVDDILSNGGKVERLLAAGHIKKASETPKVVKESQFDTKVQEPEVPVFNTNNHEGDK
jgi:hypothetical protein